LSDDILKLDNSNKLLEHGDTFYKKGEFTSAILCYEKLINNNNNDGKLWIKLGNSFLALKNYKNALFCYKKALYYNDDNKLRSNIQDIKRTIIRITSQMGGFSPNKMENRKGIPIPQTKLRLRPYTRIYQTISL